MFFTEPTSRIFRICLGAFLIAGFVSCTEEVKTNGDDANNNNSGADDSNSTNNGADSQEAKNTVYADAFYASYDGKNDYTLILLGDKVTWTAKDASMVKIEDEDVDVDNENIEKLITKSFDRQKEKREEFCEEEPDRKFCQQDFTIETFKEQFARSFKIQKITPLKAGVTTLTPSRRRGKGGGRGASLAKTLVISNFAASDYDAGNERYFAAGEGNLKACESCHLSGKENAPPHSLGRVKDFSDAAITEWVTTGQYEGVKASITHTWEFSSATQKKGIVPFLRSLQSKDINTLAEQYVGQIEGDFEDGISGDNDQ